MSDDKITPTGLARRALLKATVYTAPAIIGTLALSRDAHAQTTPSCPPAACSPNNPPCNPATPCGPRAPCGPQGCPPATCGPAGCPPVR